MQCLHAQYAWRQYARTYESCSWSYIYIEYIATFCQSLGKSEPFARQLKLKYRV